MRIYWIALIACSCAASAAVEPQQPSSQPFRVVEAGRCSPEIDGVYLTWADARAVIDRRDKADLACKMREIDLARERDEARSQLTQLAKQTPDGFMARWGLLLGVGVGSTATAVIAALLFGFAR